MQPSFITPTLPSGDHPESLSLVEASQKKTHPANRCLPKSFRAQTLVEVMMAMLVATMVMLGFLGTFLQSRKVTEANVLFSAASSLVYGIVEQLKIVDYAKLLPNGVPDFPNDPNVTALTAAPYYSVRVRINPDLTVWIRPVYTPAIDPTTGLANIPRAPTLPVAPEVTAAAVGAIDNLINGTTGLPLSTVSGTNGQALTLNIWMWIDEIPERTKDVSEVKRVTLIYTYSYINGTQVRTIRDGEVFLRTRYDQ